MNKDINIMFCPDCDWKLINGDDYTEKTNKCPICGTWTFEIFQNYLIQNGKEVGTEFGITDNDECFFSYCDFKSSKKLINKAFKLFRTQQIKEDRKKC